MLALITTHTNTPTHVRRVNNVRVSHCCICGPCRHDIIRRRRAPRARCRRSRRGHTGCCNLILTCEGVGECGKQSSGTQRTSSAGGGGISELPLSTSSGAGGTTSSSSFSNSSSSSEFRLSTSAVARHLPGAGGGAPDSRSRAVLRFW
jgi:hypothetical protein